MGGRVLEHEGKTIFNEGRNAGRNEGIAIGEARGRHEVLQLQDGYVKWK